MKNLQLFTSNPIAQAIVLACLFIISIATNSHAQVVTKNGYDYLLPEKHKTMITIGTGVPYIGIAEYSYGFTDRFSVGLLVGTTTIIPGYGIRLKSVLFQNQSNFRIFMKTPILYYPQTKGLGGEPWLLTWPSFNAEWLFKSGIRWSAGMGVVAAACANDLFGIEHPHVKEGAHHHDDDSIHMHEEDEGFMGDVWNTIQTNIAVPVGNRFSFQAEVAVVFDGTSIADEAWVGDVPVIVFLGMSYAF